MQIVEDLLRRALAAAVAVVVAAENDEGPPVCVSLVTRQGQVLAFLSRQGTGKLNWALSQAKADASAALKCDTRDMPESEAHFQGLGLSFRPGGVYILTEDGVHVGLGVSGRTFDDTRFLNDAQLADIGRAYFFNAFKAE